MKKIYSILLLAILALVTSTADAKTLYFKTDAASSGLVTIGDFGEKTFTLTDEVLTYECGEYDYFQFLCAEGYCFNSVTSDKEGWNNLDMVDNRQSSYSASSWDFADGNTCEITVVEIASLPAQKLTIQGTPKSYYFNFNYDDHYPDENGVATFDEWPEYGTIKFYGTEDYKLIKVTDEKGNKYTPDYGNYIEIYWSEISKGTPTLTVETVDRSTIAMSSFTVEVTGSKKYIVEMADIYNNNVDLSSDEPTTVKYETEDTNIKYQIQSGYSWDNKYIYQVTVNGEVLNPTYNNLWTYTPAEGDEVVIETDFPDIDVPVAFSFADGLSANVIKTLRVNNTIIETSVWTAEGFTVKYGDSVKLEFDTDNYGEFSLHVNGDYEYVSDSFSFSATNKEGYTLEIEATALVPFEVKLVCLVPEAIKGLHKGYSTSGDKYELNFVDGVATINVSPKNTGLYFDIDPAYEIASFTVNTDENAYLSYGTYYVSADCEIEVEIKKIVRENKIAVYFDPAAKFQYRMFARAYGRSDQTEFTSDNGLAQDGYNIYEYRVQDFPFNLSAYPQPFKAYLNGEVLTPYWGYFNYDLIEKNVPNNSVIKVYAEEKTPHALTYTIDDDVDVEIRHDHIAVIDNPSTHNVLPGTIVHISVPAAIATADDNEPAAADASPIVVKVNGTQAVADENGLYTVEITEDTEIAVSANNQSGIDNITIDADAVNNEIYNLQGIRVNNPSAGIYIINGKKTLVK